MVRVVQYLTAPLGRMLLTAVFLMSGANKVVHWSQTADQMTKEGMVAVPFFLAMAVLFEVGGGLSVLLGVKARLGAFALIVFLVPVTLIFHDFWQYQGQAQMQQTIHYAKNLAIVGGLLAVLTHGAGPISFDARHAKRTKNRLNPRVRWTADSLAQFREDQRYGFVRSTRQTTPADAAVPFLLPGRNADTEAHTDFVYRVA